MEKEAIKHCVYDESSKLGWKCLSCSFLISVTYELIIIIKLVFKKKLHLIMGRYSCSAREMKGGFAGFEIVYAPNSVLLSTFILHLGIFILKSIYRIRSCAVLISTWTIRCI